ncbi:MAG: hypothetical protein Q8L48_32130 [Archangium sp.]|nr:hypothetical protein [Archangium sp.]
MWRRLWWLLPLVAAAACTGLYLEQGNAYPCDFSEGPGLRDAVCQPGDVCGINNVCRKYIYEGPRFEAGLGLTVPTFGPGSGEGAVLHPLVLNQKVEFVTREVLPGGSTFLSMKDANGALQVFELDFLGQLTQVALPPMLPPGPPPPLAPFTDATGARKVLIHLPLRLAVGDLETGTVAPLPTGQFRDVVVPELSFDAGVLVASLATPVVWDQTQVSVVRQQSANAWTLEPLLNATGRYDDVAGLPTVNALWLVMLKNDTLELHTLDGGQAADVSLDPLPMSTLPGTIRTDVAGRVVVVERGNVLSTFQVLSTAAGLTLTRAWPDCRPCDVTDPPAQISPTTATGTVRIELVCGALDAVVVTGSIARSQTDRCTTEEIDLLPQARRFATASWDSQAGILLGGQHGQVWTGESISSLRPAYLDRVPLDVAPGEVGGVPVTAALTDDYVAVQQATGQTGLHNGFRRVLPDELRFGPDARLGGFVHGIANWGVSTAGDLVALRTEPGPALPRFGPALVRASGEPIGSTIGGESFTLEDGGVIFFLAADDSLYRVSNPDQQLSLRPSDEVVTPDLTPEPSVPIRSLALERTPLGTGEDYARGYLVTSRDVFAWELGGNPLRWSSTPLELSSGEPLEVWFDSTRSALGRVGFSDGQISTLPGGYELAEPLPANEEVPPQVLDYENLGGWPVAYATTGVFIAGWDVVNGKLQNRFPDGGINRPMSWREVTLEGANPKPWMRDGGLFRPTEAKPGRLFVSVDPPVGKEQTYRLLLFLDDQVLQVARHVRSLR